MKRKWLEKLKKVEELASQYKRHPISLAYSPKLSRPWQPSSVWRLFPRQEAAFQFAKICKEDVHVFALETVLDDTERRLYLVTTYAEFWFYYMEQNTPFCCPICPERGNTPFLVINYRFCPWEGSEGKDHHLAYWSFSGAMSCMQKPLRKRPQSLAHCYEVIPADTVCKLYFDLEYYKPANPGADGIKMVALVIKFFSKKLEDCFGVKCSADNVLNLDSSTDEKFSRHLIFLLPNAAFKDNIHVGVYTKNRNFRLYKSSKLGKNVNFKVAKDNKFAVKPSKHVSEEAQIFLCSLISNVRFTDSLKVLTCARAENERNGASGPSTAASVMTGSTMKGYQFSPYPEIDHFILSLLTREGFHGGIRQWNYFSIEELLVYDTVNYRWCENIGQAHKSNNVMLIVDLKKEMWYQKCYDPDCRAQNFKSECYPLPPEVCLPFILKEEDEESSLTMDENGNIRDVKQNVLLTAELDVGNSMTSLAKKGIVACHTVWECCIDDASILEAAEDAELVDAANLHLGDWSAEETDIPDELLLEAVDAHRTSEEI
ncbi:DNA-directed primase/polymerase protein isoform X3 [Rhinoderma darwinii]|uniref:DNA-directed primase/polymerase protein isoform X3 n=1 Tax=Rhinoderma darwinii TaxID=43563 RepID=UPI003F66B49F